eukprot:6157392-Amphidinium_carterae.1
MSKMVSTHNCWAEQRVLPASNPALVVIRVLHSKIVKALRVRCSLRGYMFSNLPPTISWSTFFRGSTSEHDVLTFAV